MDPRENLYGSKNINIPQRNEKAFNHIQIIRTQDIEADQKAKDFSVFKNEPTISKENQISKQKMKKIFIMISLPNLFRLNKLKKLLNQIIFMNMNLIILKN